VLFAVMLVLHEIGHALVLRSQGGRVRVLTLSLVPHVIADGAPSDDRYMAYALGGVMVDALMLVLGLTLLGFGNATANAALAGVAALIVLVKLAALVWNLWPIPWNDGSLALETWNRIRLGRGSEAEALRRTARQGRGVSIPIAACVASGLWVTGLDPVQRIIFPVAALGAGVWVVRRWASVGREES